MHINKYLSKYNYNRDSLRRIKYIVIHYVGADGDAKDNCAYFASGNRSASAHYFIGYAGDIWQSVEDQNVAWHCGASSYKYPECRNSNSIGIELCVKNKGSHKAASKDWYFEDATVAAAVELTKYLMDKYSIPASNVIRHYDVTGKICPNPYVYNTSKHTWDAFKKAIASKTPVPPADKLYRVRKTWNDAKSQTGAYSNLDNAIKACAEGFSVFDHNGNIVYTTEKKFKTYMVNVDTDKLKISAGPGLNYEFKGYTGKGTFTIVEEAEGSGASKWGRLKSGSGWISLDNVKRI